MLKFQTVTRTGSTLTLTIQTHANHTYDLQSAAVLAGPWQPVTTNVTVQTNPAGLRTWTLTSVPAGRRFYRVAVGP